jgi:hypothetical protein
VVASKNGSGVWVTPVSDERLKTNIVTVDPAVASAELCALRLVSFDYTAEAAAALGTTGRHTGWVGFLADEYDAAMSTLAEDRVLSRIECLPPQGSPTTRSTQVVPRITCTPRTSTRCCRSRR